MEYLPVTMLREDLENIPRFDLPPGYSVRKYRAGDRATWVRIWQESEQHLTINDDTFESQFAFDMPGFEKRGRFLVAPDGQDVGTATAWYNRRYRGRSWAMAHWVAIVPAHRGKGLCKSLLTAVVTDMRSMRHKRVMLGTQTVRLAAIKSYLDFGFVPDMSADGARHAWGMVASEISHPILDVTLQVT